MGVLNDCEDYGFGLYGSIVIDMGWTFLGRKNKPSWGRVKGGGINPHESWHDRLNRVLRCEKPVKAPYTPPAGS
jgi:hypothetical protein